MTKAYDDALEKYDVLLMPTVKYVATKLPEAEANMLGTVLLNIIQLIPHNTWPYGSPRTHK